MSFINSIKKDGGNIILYKCGQPVPELLVASGDSYKICFLDTETTGVDRSNDEIIELALKVVIIEGSTGKIVSVDTEYTSFNDPHIPLSDEIIKLTGITDDMVNGHSIDWSEADRIIENGDLIVAHNASFDRAFMDRKSAASRQSIWACTVQDIDWLQRDFTSSKQDLLCFWHGFYFDAHRAMNDVDALIHLVTHHHYTENRPVCELIGNSQKPSYVIKATNFAYDETKKDQVKANGYRWNNVQKIWSKRVTLDVLEDEKEWLTGIIYDGYFDGLVEEINLADKYKM